MNTRTFGLQKETRNYLRRLYAYGRELRGEDVADIDEFVKGLKQLNLWQNTVCWMMRSQHNIGTGSTVLSLGGGGKYDGVMVNSPSWGNDGISFGPSVAGTQINYPNMSGFIKNDTSIIGITNKHGQDNAMIFECRNTTSVAYCYAQLSTNDNTVSQLCIPTTSRNFLTYTQSNRGGTVPVGNTCIGGSIFNTSQASYKNGNLISNETNLATRNPINVAPNINRTGNGNIRVGTFIVPIVILTNKGLNGTDHINLYNILKFTVSKNLGLT